MSVHIITDSASDARTADSPCLTVLPLGVTFGEEELEDGVTLSHDDFYRRLDPQKPLPVTSQITPYQFLRAISPHRERGEEVVVITMSSKLSGTCQSAHTAAGGDQGIYVVDSMNVTVGQRVLVAQACRMAEKGASGAEIVRALEQIKNRTRLVAVMDTLDYLQKGGRISKAIAIAGSVLGIKPVVESREGIIAVIGKARGQRQGHQRMADRIRETGGIDFSFPWFLGYTGLTNQLLRSFMESCGHLWSGHTPTVTSVGAAIGTHVGPGAIALAWVGIEA